MVPSMAPPSGNMDQTRPDGGGCPPVGVRMTAAPTDGSKEGKTAAGRLVPAGARNGGGMDNGGPEEDMVPADVGGRTGTTATPAGNECKEQRHTQEKMDGGKDGGSEAGRAPPDEKERSGGVREYRGKITDFYNYTTNWKDEMQNGRRLQEHDRTRNENDDVGGSGGRNADTTVMKWKTMMSKPAKRVKLKVKTRSKPKKKFVRGAKSGIWEEQSGRANMGRTDSSQWNYLRNASLGATGNSHGSCQIQRCKGNQESNLSCNNHTIVKTIFLKRANKS